MTFLRYQSQSPQTTTYQRHCKKVGRLIDPVVHFHTSQFPTLLFLKQKRTALTIQKVGVIAMLLHDLEQTMISISDPKEYWEDSDYDIDDDFDLRYALIAWASIFLL